MSNKVVSWVYEHSTVDDVTELAVLVAMADEANDDGYLSGKTFGAIARIARKTRVHPETVTNVHKRLEDLREIVVCRPADRRQLFRPGRHNEYVILMGRDPLSEATDRSWSAVAARLDRSTTPTYPQGGSTEGAPTPSPATPAMDGPDQPAEAHRDRQAVPSAASDERLTEAETEPTRPRSEGSITSTFPPPIGRRQVDDRSTPSGATRSTPVPKEPAGSAREGPPVDDPLAELAAALSAAGFAVPWDLTDGQRSSVLEHLGRWPSYAAGVEAFTALVAARVQGHGLPRSARAWVAPWLEVPAPKPRSVQLPPAPCPKPEHSGEPIGADGTCVLCKADARVGDRT